MAQLPIFRLRTPNVGVPDLLALGKGLFGLPTFSLPVLGSRLSLVSGSLLVDLEKASGGVWAADNSQLWNPELRPSLPSESEAAQMATRLMGQLPLPKLDPKLPFRLRQLGVGGTELAVEANGKRQDHRLDLHVQQVVTLDLGDSVPGLKGEIPIVGGGGKFGITLGDRGRVIGFNGVWRPVESSFLANQIPQQKSNEDFLKMASGLRIDSHESFLAYYSAPAWESQQFLFPVYVHSAVARFGEQVVPLRMVTLPASEFGPFPKIPAPQPKRTLLKPPIPFVEPDERRGMRNPSVFESGTSWIGTSGGLPGSQNNAKGFVDGLAAEGWKTRFNWGDGNAFESDWRGNDDDWVDAVDFVFYAGHANGNGWVLSKPDDGFLDFAETGGAPGTPGDLWGQHDLEWMIIAACGPLQDDVLSKGGGNVLSRWDGAFDGLHTLMGYGAITFDNETEGKKVVEYARGGQPLIDAWFRTAREIQPSTNGKSAPNGPTVYVGAMWVSKSDANPRMDHLWNRGSVSADPTSPTSKTCMWTTC